MLIISPNITNKYAYFCTGSPLKAVKYVTLNILSYASFRNKIYVCNKIPLTAPQYHL